MLMIDFTWKNIDTRIISNSLRSHFEYLQQRLLPAGKYVLKYIIVKNTGLMCRCVQSNAFISNFACYLLGLPYTQPALFVQSHQWKYQNSV